MKRFTALLMGLIIAFTVGCSGTGSASTETEDDVVSEEETTVDIETPVNTEMEVETVPIVQVFQITNNNKTYDIDFEYYYTTNSIEDTYTFSKYQEVQDCVNYIQDYGDEYIVIQLNMNFETNDEINLVNVFGYVSSENFDKLCNTLEIDGKEYPAFAFCRSKESHKYYEFNYGLCKHETDDWFILAKVDKDILEAANSIVFKFKCYLPYDEIIDSVIIK